MSELDMKLIKRKEVARLLNVEPHTLTAWNKRGILRHLKWNRSMVRYDPSDVKAFLEMRGINSSVDALLTRQQVAKKFGVKRYSVYRWTKSGKLPCIELCHNVLRYDPKVVEQLFSNA